MILALFLAAAAPAELRWEGRAVVHAGRRTIPIQVRTKLRADGSVVSESWPLAEGEAKGLRRMIIDAEGSGWLERGGKSEVMPEVMLREEGAQYGFYLQLQDAWKWCEREPRGGDSVRILPGAVQTAFRCRGRQVTRAANWVAAPGAPVRQDFQLVGRWRAGGFSFPRKLVLRRDRQPYFELVVTRFAVR